MRIDIFSFPVPFAREEEIRRDPVIHRMRTILTTLLLLAAPMNGRSECVGWFGSYWKPFKGSGRVVSTFSVDNGRMRVDFFPDTFWTIGRIFIDNEMVGQDSGGTGSVVHWDGKPVGTVHREGDLSEKLLETVVIVDGKTTPLTTQSTSAAGEIRVDPVSVYRGSGFVLIKKSVIGPFLHEARFTIEASSNTIRIRHHYEAMEDITPERFDGYRYVFMHMMPLDLTEWLTVNADKTITEGTLREIDANKDREIWRRPVLAFAAYSPWRGAGVAYAYPALYAGGNHFIYRQGKDTKFRGILFDRDHYQKGEKLDWEQRVIPFSSRPEEWRKNALGLIAKPGEGAPD